MFINGFIQDSDFTIDTLQPDLTDCFQKSILTLIPCGLLWFFSLLYVPYIWQLRDAYPWCHITWLNLLKVVSFCYSIYIYIYIYIY